MIVHSLATSTGRSFRHHFNVLFQQETHILFLIILYHLLYGGLVHSLKLAVKKWFISSPQINHGTFSYAGPGLRGMVHKHCLSINRSRTFFWLFMLLFSFLHAQVRMFNYLFIVDRPVNLGFRMERVSGLIGYTSTS